MNRQTGMDPARWAAIEELFHNAVDLPAGERAGYLERACGADGGLRREVEALLSSVEESDEGLRQAVGSEAGALLDAPAAGRTIGAYRIVSRLGQGGMGSVYLAVRADDQFEKRVAIKLIRADAGGRPSLVRRFLVERQILANLEHPHIARLLDGGVTPEGHPYLVMEYVDGQPVDEYARSRGLGVDERLRLFLDVCEAVRHAHRNMVIHRDLKPSNVLVDGEGAVKLLDFGIARIAREDPGGPAHPMTVAGERMLTPDYASPEMIRGGPVTAAADVYSLGVLLYELLTLARPFRVGTASLFEMERAIMTTEPARPSAVPGGLLAGLGRDRRLDLDAIVGKAMRKDPAERYESVEALARDVQRYLEAFPVRARAGSRRYRFRKFARRHRAAVAAAALFTITLAAFGTGMALLAARAARERDAAQQERARAETVSSFLVSLFAGADPRHARGETVTARDLLDRGAQRIAADLEEQPGVRSRLLATIGQAYQYLGLLERSEAVFAQQLEVERAASGPRSPSTLQVLRQLADIQRMRGNYAGARRNLRQALESQLALLGPDALEISHTSNNLALVEQALGNLQEAVRLFREAVRVISRYPAEEAEALTMRGNLGAALQESGELEAAEAELREVLARRTRLLGENHPQRVRSMGRLARALFRNGAYGEAARLTAEAIPLSVEVWGPAHPDTLFLLALDAEYRWQFRRDRDASRVLAEVARQGASALGGEHPDVLVWGIQAAALRASPDAAGLALCRSALPKLEKGAGERSLALARGLELCGELALQRGEAAEALRLASRGIEIRRAIQPGGHPDWAPLLALAGRANQRLGRLAEAERLLEEAVAAGKTRLRRPHLHTAAHLWALGAILEARGRGEAGRKLQAEAQALRREIARNSNPASGTASAGAGSGTSSATSPVMSNAQSPVR